METIGIWVSVIIVAVVILKAFIYLFFDCGSMPEARYTINDENNPTSVFYNNDNDDVLTNPIYSDLPCNIWHDSSSNFDDY